MYRRTKNAFVWRIAAVGCFNNVSVKPVMKFTNMISTKFNIFMRWSMISHFETAYLIEMKIIEGFS